MRSAAIALIAMLSLASNAAAQTQKRDVDINAPDGVTLKGTYVSPGRSGPAMLLLHQCDMDRHAWDGFAASLGDAGIHVLTVDFRGFGDSGGKPVDAAGRQALSAKWPADADLMLAFLLTQPGVDRSRVAAGGASCGVAQSTALAVRHPEIKTLVELSGNATDETKAFLTRTPGLAVFGAASEGDAGAAIAIRALIDASKNPRSTLKIYTGSEHGVPMFAKNRDLGPLLVSWLKTQLAVQ